MSETAMQSVLDPLVARGEVARQEQGVEPATFRLTMTGVERLKNHREYSEARAGREWRKTPSEGPQEPRSITWTWAGETPPTQQGNPALEQALIEQLEHVALSRAELVRRVGASDHEVQAALDKLVGETFVARYPEDNLPAEYGLTEGGLGRLRLIREFTESPMSAMGKVLGAAASEAVQRRRRVPAVRARSTRMRLSDSERTACSTALAEQFGLGRIDIGELHRRTDLLLAATTRNDLGVVFDGLPFLVLDKQQVQHQPSHWRMVALGSRSRCRCRSCSAVGPSSTLTQM
ncbi:DUF1707 domain-containing protein [Kribbella sp. NBC_01505]